MIEKRGVKYYGRDILNPLIVFVDFIISIKVGGIPSSNCTVHQGLQSSAEDILLF